MTTAETTPEKGAEGAPEKRRRAGRKRFGGRGALTVLAVLLGTSGVIRLGAGAVLAVEKSQEVPAMPVVAEAGCAPDGGAIAMLDALRSRESRIAEREAMLDDREQAMTVARAEIDKKMAELTSAEDRLSRTLAMASDAADEDVTRLVAVYEKMKPKDAATLFAEMDPNFAAGFLGKMRPDAAAAVMAGLDPKEAYSISVILAGRNAGAPTE